METQKISIGSLVTLSCNYQPSLFPDLSPMIIGDPNIVSPILIVVEFRKEARNSYNEQDGQLLTSKNEISSKVVWYSDRTGQFEQTWISSKYLNVLNSEIQNDFTGSVFSVGDKVILKTINFENRKQKLSKTIEQGKEKTKLTSLLTFAAPPCVVMSKTQVKSGLQQFDKKNGELLFQGSEITLKVKYYNSVSSKYSEISLPESCFLRIEDPNTPILRVITEYKDLKDAYFKSSTIKLGNQISVEFNGVFYFLKYFDVLENKFVSKKISELSEFKLFSSQELITSSLPRFEEKYNKLHITEISSETLKKIIKQKKYARIIYKNHRNEITTRIIRIKKTIELKTSSDNTDNMKTQYYLEAHCYLRKANRFFLIGNIQSIEILDLE